VQGLHKQQEATRVQQNGTAAQLTALQRSLKGLQNTSETVLGKLEAVEQAYEHPKHGRTRATTHDLINYAVGGHGKEQFARTKVLSYGTPQPSPWAFSSLATQFWYGIRQGQDNPPELSLAGNDLGEAWCFRGNKATAQIHLSRSVVVETIALTHPFIEYVEAMSRHRPERLRTSPPLNFTVTSATGELLGRFSYDIKHQKEVGRRQVFTVAELQHPLEDVILTVHSQHFPRPWTCVYQFEVLAKPLVPPMLSKGV